MGASPEVIRAAYETHTVYQRPAFLAPETTGTKETVVITESNWKDFLGDERYYQAYVAFFSKLLLSGTHNALQSVMDDYIFSTNANLVLGKNGTKPVMLSRFLAGFLHPLIHTGYGAEFGLPGLAAEGLAQAAAHRVEAESVFTPKFFGSPSASGPLSRLSSLLHFPTPASRSDVPPPDVHALSVLARVAKEPAFEAKNVGLPVPREQLQKSVDLVVDHAGAKLMEYAEQWTKTVRPERNVLVRKFEEIVWVNTVVYGVGGWGGRSLGGDEQERFNADFFCMHGVTSALMVAPLLSTLSANSAALLLRTYFIFSLVLYVARGRPAIPIQEFYTSTSPYPSPPGPKTQAAKETLEPFALPNPWLPIIQTTLVHLDEHLCKAQRALLHFAECFGGLDAGAFASCGLDGADVLDGTLFARVASLTADRLGWMREGEEKRGWDFKGLFEA
ncbi:uncharacterized protein PHACADRAFT_261904 [Phanerochaete carnosa HHB-10118-sp]|uniref:Uncharacterized protein n=1 Tax=Phanerochaete carnosa (strain HHB-10118-sp) TaxID=650164 RepID=K5VYG2_PHACS|nr:uncharacterized protein PHACADRAFT_261904 [Phanerochaete carnosa HHB-10118-sp]EKM51649.1 hypothetical protein PHACADRAFT_261904 [Phanerochaete carnosa HHB-10118-sp]